MTHLQVQFDFYKCFLKVPNHFNQVSEEFVSAI